MPLSILSCVNHQPLFGGGFTPLANTPLSLNGCTLWLDAADGSTITSSANVVSQWNDKSGKGYNFTGGSTPKTGTFTINGLNVIDLCSNSTSYFSNANVQMGTNYTVFVVGYTTDPASSPIALGGYVNNNMYIGVTGNYYACLTGDGTTWNGTGANTPNVSVNVNTIMEMTNNSTVNGLIPYTNGTAQNSKYNPLTYTPKPFNGLAIGTYLVGGVASGQYWKGYIGEIIVYTRVLNQTERQYIEGYLAWKWGLVGNLPTTHPYYSIPPSMYFTPTSIGINNSLLWLDAASSWSIVTSGNNTVSTWKDKSGKFYNFTGVNGPVTRTTKVNGLNVLDITATNSYFTGTTLPIPANYSVFTVSYNNGSTNGSFVRGSTDGYIGMGIGNSGYLYYLVGNGAWQVVPAPYSSAIYTNPASPFIACMTVNSSNLVAYANGSFNVSTTATNASTTGLNLGLSASGIGYNGYFAEVLIFNKALSDVYRQYIEGYLAWKWGLQNTLPVIHPYYNTAPNGDIMDYQFRVKGGTSTVPTTDVSGTYTLTNTGNVTMVYDNTRGFVFNFSGSNYLSVQPGSSTTATTATTSTRTLWVKTSTPTAGQGNVFSSNLWPIWFQATNYLGTSSGTGSRIADPNIEGTGWVFYAVTTTASTITLYVNGTSVASGATTFSGDASYVQFGAFQSANNYTGQLDDMRQYSYVLTASQIAQIYNATNNYAVAPRTFSPTFIPGSNRLWLDATDTNTIAASSGNVSTWYDKSGFANNFTGYNNPQTGTKLVNGLNVMDVSTNSSAYFRNTTMTFPASYTLFAVGYTNQPTGSATNSPLLFFCQTNYVLIFTAATTTVTSYCGIGQGTAWTYLTGTGTLMQTMKLYTITNNSTTPLTNVYSNGTVIQTQNTTASIAGTGLYVAGASNINTVYNWTGFVGEVIMYNSVLSDIHRQTIEGYLAWKWGLQSNLPSAHIFKNATPQIDLFNYQFRLKNVYSTIITQDVTNTYTITNNGSVSIVNDASRGYVFSFSGSNYLSLQTTSTTGAYATRTFWVKTSNQTSGGGNICSSPNWPVRFNGTNFLNSTPGTVTSATDPTNEGTNWTFYACTTNLTNTQIYVNGNTTPVATATLSSNFTGDTSYVQIGALSGAGFYTGYLDDIRQYNYVLSGSQIQTIYNATK